MKKNIYAVLSVVGVVAPYTQFVPWSMTYGLDMRTMISMMFANQIAAGIAIDALLAAVAIVLFIIFDSRKEKVPHAWVPIVAIAVSGIACALPLYLYLRERTFERRA